MAHVFLGSSSSVAHGGEIVIFGPTAMTRFGHSVAGAGDVNADAIADVVIGGDAGPGYVNIVAGRWLYAAGSQVKFSLRSLVGANVGAAFGVSVVGLGDVNGDGYCDVAASTPDASPPFVRIFAGGGVPSSVPVASIGDPMISVARSLGVAGLSDGDARADLLVGACSTASPNVCSNVARIYAGLSSTGSSMFRNWSWSSSEPYFGAGVNR